MSMNANRYSERRNELLEKLEEILAIDKMPEHAHKEIQFVHDKLVSNVFNIVLIGEFQGGKSTTFNAICDGREISPRGAMVKTSACRISAQNIPDPSVDEYAELKWKSDEELLMSMIDLISPRLREKSPSRFLSMPEIEMVKNLKLTDANDLALVRECLNDEWSFYCEDKASYDPDASGILDVLRVALLIAEHVDNPELVALRNRNKISVQELGRLVTFPQGWEDRWSRGSANGFSFVESAFAFLGSVMCYIHSPNLARLGCVITDCPGLFASVWDTDVARKAMFESDAILYLIGGTTQMSQGDIKALKEIRVAKQEHKLFFAVNVKQSRDAFKSNILPTDIGILKNAGFEHCDETCVYLFHALLGLCSRNGDRINAGDIDDESARRFVEVSKKRDPGYSDDPKACWNELVSDLLRTYTGGKHSGLISDYSILGSESGLDTLFEIIERTVVNKKAEALLVSGGSTLVNRTFSILESDLLAREDAAKKTLEEFLAQEAAARAALEGFNAEAMKEINRIKEPHQGRALAYDFFDNVILRNADALSTEVAEGLANRLMTFLSVKDALSGIFKSEEEKKRIVLEKAMPILQKAVTDVFTPAAEGWLTNIYDGNSEVYEESLGQCQRDIINQLHRQWSKLVSADDILLKGLDERLSPVVLTEVVSNQIVSAEPFDGMTPDAMAVKNRALIMAALTAPITALITGVFFIGGNLLLAAIFGFIVVGWIPVIIAAILAYITSDKLTTAIKNRARRGFIEKTKTKLRVQLTNPEVKSKVIDGAMKLIHEQLQVNLHKCLEKRLDGQKNEFQRRCSEAQKGAQAKNEDKERIAREAQALREEHIEPAHKWCEDFENAVLTELKA